MKLVIAVVQGEDAPGAMAKLTEAGIGSTRIATSGGFLHQGNVTLLIGVENKQVPKTLKIIQENCQERTRYLTPVAPLAGRESSPSRTRSRSWSAAPRCSWSRWIRSKRSSSTTRRGSIVRITAQARENHDHRSNLDR